MHNYHKIFPPKSKAATLFYDIHIGMALVCIPIILFKCFHSLSLLSLPGISMNSKPPKSQLFWKVWGFCMSNSYTNAFLLFLPLSPELGSSKAGDNSYPLPTQASQTPGPLRAEELKSMILGRSGLLIYCQGLQGASGDWHRMSHQSVGLELLSEERERKGLKYCLFKVRQLSKI